MSLWLRYIAWLDRDIRASWPFLFGYSMAVPLVPVAIGLLLGIIFQPVGAARLILATLVSLPIMAGLGLIFWRAFVEMGKRLKRSSKSNSNG